MFKLQGYQRVFSGRGYGLNLARLTFIELFRYLGGIKKIKKLGLFDSGPSLSYK